VPDTFFPLTVMDTVDMHASLTMQSAGSIRRNYAIFEKACRAQRCAG
jgi:hypothetical protein